ncbi:MAG: TetR/AcrR family transcriptional regulator [Actinomycetaceae bacterium]|nr:TetR/AcrR family transcriptional regulator [Actinomycetaceae bacterium]
MSEHREKTRQALFGALSSLLHEYPFDQITMAQIARRAGIGRTAIYNHFEDKETLLLELMSSATEAFARILLEALQVVDDPLQKLRIYVRARLELKKQFHLAVEVNIRNVSQPPAKLREHGKIVRDVMFNLLREAYESGQISQPPTPQTIGLVQACLAGQDLPDSPLEREHVKINTEKFILRALGASEESVDWIDPRVSELNFVFEENSSSTIHEGEPGCPI